VIFAAARVTLKQHRFEVVAAALAAVALGLWALFLEYRLRAINVPPACFGIWQASGPDGAGDCAGPIHVWGSILAEEGSRIIGAMAYLPFAVGLLGGVPIVAREVELRTAQTAWSLNGSRFRWLIRQVAPVAILLGLAVAFAALAASGIQADREIWGQSPFLDLGLHGPLVLARAFGAFGIGLLLGALVGRSLPAFVLGAVLSLQLVSGVGVVRDAWLAGQHPVVIDNAPTVVTTGWAWRTPEGTQISDQAAKALVPAEVSKLDSGQDQAVHSIGWLEDHGYRLLALGVTDEMALGWAPYDALLFSLVGMASFAGAIILVNRRRPT
jgi:hypothetical protein